MAKPIIVSTHTEIPGFVGTIPPISNFPNPNTVAQIRGPDQPTYDWTPIGEPHITYSYDKGIMQKEQRCGWGLRWERILALDEFQLQAYEEYVSYANPNLIRAFDMRGATPLAIGTFLMLTELLDREKAKTPAHSDLKQCEILYPDRTDFEKIVTAATAFSTDRSGGGSGVAIESPDMVELEYTDKETAAAWWGFEAALSMITIK